MIENKLKEYIIKKFGNVRQFALKINLPYTTIDSILKRGLDNSNVGNVIRICKALDISIDNLVDEKKIVPNSNLSTENHERYKQILKDKGLMDENENINEDKIDDLIRVAEMMKKFNEK